jgi:hypothetical protein
MAARSRDVVEMMTCPTTTHPVGVNWNLEGPGVWQTLGGEKKVHIYIHIYIHMGVYTCMYAQQGQNEKFFGRSLHDPISNIWRLQLTRTPTHRHRAYQT